MSRAWFVIPSARPVAEVLPVVAKWREMGYGVALQRDVYTPEESEALSVEGVTIYWREYAGYADAVNYLAKEVLRTYPEVKFIVTGGDDTLPDPNVTGDEIADEITGHFTVLDVPIANQQSTFCVMQPTGHRWGEEDPGARKRWPDAPAYIDRVCGSPFLGREFCRRANAGLGPLHPAYFHMHSDEHTQEYAKSLGILWQRPDLTHFHNHWGLTGDARKMPEFLKFVNSKEHWRESKAILDHHKSNNFAECQPIR